MMNVPHKVDSEDLVHCDLMAVCAFFAALLMRGLQFKQAVAVVERAGRFNRRANNLAGRQKDRKTEIQTTTILYFNYRNYTPT